MKRFFPFAIAALFAACNSTSTTVANGDTVATDTMVTPAPVMPDTVTTTVYAPVEGDVIYKDGKTMVMRNGQWVEVDHDITLDNGVVVTKKGTAKKGKVEVTLDDGEVVTKTGNFFDRTGKAIDNAWQDTKDAVKDAGNAVGKAAKDLKHQVDTTFGKDKK